MASSTPEVIRKYQEDIKLGWKESLFFGNKRLKERFVLWLVSKNLGESNEQREEFLWAIQGTLESQPHWTAEAQQSTKDNISEVKDRFDTLSSLADKISVCLRGISRISGAQVELMMALARQDEGLSKKNQDQSRFLLREGPAYFNHLSKAAASAESNLAGTPGTMTFFDGVVSFIGTAWQHHFDLKPSPSEKSKFNQFIQLLNKEIGTCLPTSSSSLRRALKQ